MSKSDLLRDKLLDELTDDEVEVEKIVQLTRIADALEAIEATGIYVYQEEAEQETPINHVERRRG